MRWLAPAGALVLPYRRVTHSGQLELACDLGLPVVAPYVPTLAAQLDHNGAQSHPVIWFPPSELTRSKLLAERLTETWQLSPVDEASRQAFLHQRMYEAAAS